MLFGALSVVCVGKAYAESDFERALSAGRAKLEALDIDGARGQLEVAIAVAQDPAQRAIAFDLLGAAQGIDAQYWQAFQSFFIAAQEDSASAVTSVNHAQIPTRRIARCAVRLESAGVTIEQAESLLRAQLPSEVPNDRLDGLLAAALFGERFMCPEPDTPPPPSIPEAAGVLAPEFVTVPEDVGGGPKGPPVMTWVLGAVAVAAAGTGATLGAITLSQAEDASTLNAQQFEEYQGSGRVTDQPAATNVAFAVAGGAALGAILFWVLDLGHDDPNSEEPSTMITPTGVRVTW